MWARRAGQPRCAGGSPHRSAKDRAARHAAAVGHDEADGLDIEALQLVELLRIEAHVGELRTQSHRLAFFAFRLVVQRRLLASLAPSRSASNFAQITVGCTSVLYIACE